MAGYTRNRMFFTVSTLTMLSLAAYVCFRLLPVIDVSPFLRVLLGVLVFIASQSITLMRVVVTLTPGLSFFWIRAGGYVSAVFMILVSLVLARDAALCLLWLVDTVSGHGYFANLRITLNGAGADSAILAGSLGCAALGMWSALRVPRINELEIPLPSLPAGLDGLRIAHLSDLHMGSTFDAVWLSQVVERTNAMHPDLILITGDLVDGRPAVLGEDMRLLERLKAHLDVVISVGNHEYYSGVMPWVRTWRNHGLTVLLNEHKVYEWNGEKLVIAGVADPNAAHFPGLVMPDPVGAKEGAPDAFTILMAHQPKDAALHATLGYDLQLSGHTHGGQYFFLFPLVSWLNKGYRSGLYTVNGMTLHVSPGTGLWGYVPMRVGSPSEITILTLRSQQ